MCLFILLLSELYRSWPHCTLWEEGMFKGIVGLFFSVFQGELFLNGQMCRIVQRELLFDLGVAYGIDCLLMDPTLGGRCDTFTAFNVTVSSTITQMARDQLWSSSMGSKEGP